MIAIDLHTKQKSAESIAHEAGILLRDFVQRPLNLDSKTSSIDLVTEADRQSEALIVSRLREYFPADAIVGEEGGDYAAENDSVNSFRWFIDPLDGTVNFAHRLPHFSISMALVNPNNQPVIGVIYDPMHNECFTAVQGHGAFLNGVRLHVSATEKLAQSLLVTGFSYDTWANPDNNVEQFGDFMVRTQGVRRLGSAALDMAYVAAGRLDGYWEQKLQQWDVMAGVLLVKEAGGKVTDYHGNQTEVFQKRPRVVASNGSIHDEMIEVLRLGKAAPRPQP